MTRFARTVPIGDDTAAYQPLDERTRAEHHRPGNAGPAAWPIRLTRCGEHPGHYGDNQPVQRLQAAR
jgi:hypothetical protein